MEEIVIDEKKYVSSKRAAKLTGYAKDYVGQLCREGRVSARLVGRSWYVLESAIHDHRFGAQQAKHEDTSAQEMPDSHLKLQSTWESPRYEADTADILPSINRLRNTDYKATETLNEKKTDQPDIGDIAPSEASNGTGLVNTPPTVNFDGKVDKTSENIERTQLLEEGEVNIPVNTKYALPPEDLLPRQSNESGQSQPPATSNSLESGKSLAKTNQQSLVFRGLQAVLITMACIAFIVATTNSGVIDRWISSHNRATVVTGISKYIR